MNTADNLRRLADHIEKNVSQKFIDMFSFYDDDTTMLSNSRDEMCYIAKHGVNECGTSACALGHAATVWPEEAQNANMWIDFSIMVFPDLHPSNSPGLWKDTFGSLLSSDKQDVIDRLRETANILESEQ